MIDTPLVRLEGVSHTYGEHPIHLDVAQGDILGIVGPSGSGKTTLLRILLNAVVPSGAGSRADLPCGRATSPRSRR